MSIRFKIILGMLGVCGLFVGMILLLQCCVIAPSFRRLEAESARRDLLRCVNAIDRDIDAISNGAFDYSAWDESCRYIQDRNAEFERVNLNMDGMMNNTLHLACYLASDGEIVFFQARDPATLESIDLPDLRECFRKPGSRWAGLRTPEQHIKGIVLTGRGIMQLAARPIITSKKEGPVRGSVIFGRFFDAAEIEHLARQTQLALKAWPAGAPSLAPADRDATNRLRQGDPLLLVARDKQVLDAYASFPGVDGRPLLVIKATIPRSITAQGRLAARWFNAAALAGGLAILVFAWTGISRTVVSPLMQLTGHAVHVGSTGDLKARLAMAGCDEIGALAREFDEMVRHLAEAREQMLETAHRAGMAEIATEVLHNVGNAVNTLSVAAETLDERLRDSKTGGLTKAAALLEENRGRLGEFFGQDPRGGKLAEYLARLSQGLAEEQRNNLADVERLQRTIRHVCDIVALQQAHAGSADFLQETDVADLAEQVLQFHDTAIRRAGIEVVRDYAPLPALPVSRNKLMQVLMNLVKNAVESIALRDGPVRRLTVRILARPEEWEIAVEDTGAGIESADLARIFNHGFTTKADGHGFGLHYCANAAAEMGGRIVAASDGPGRGAQFRLVLPQAAAVETATK